MIEVVSLRRGLCYAAVINFVHQLLLKLMLAGGDRFVVLRINLDDIHCLGLVLLWRVTCAFVAPLVTALDAFLYATELCLTLVTCVFNPHSDGLVYSILSLLDGFGLFPFIFVKFEIVLFEYFPRLYQASISI